MAFIHGKNATFKVDNSAAALQDLSAFTDEVTISIPIEAPETTTFGKSAKAYIVGLKDGKITAKGKFDAASNAVDQVLGGILGQSALVTVEVVPGGGAVSATNPKYSAECILVNYEVGAPVGDVVTWSAEFQPADGNGITRATA